MLRGLGFALLVSIFMVGCDPEQRLELSEATLEGSITLKGKPVPHALVIVSGSGPAAQGFADASGQFKITNCPSGAVRIGVNSDAGRGNMMGAMMAARQGNDKSSAPSFVDVPKKYFDPNTSGIETQVSDPKGVNKFDIKLN